MPIQDWTLQATWDFAYRIKADAKIGDGRGSRGPRSTRIYTHYHNFVVKNAVGFNMQALVTKLNIVTGARIVVIGAGFGWSVEWLNANGYIAIAVDPNQYLISKAPTSEETEITTLITAKGRDKNELRIDPSDKIEKPMLDILVRQDGKRTSEILIDEDMKNSGSRRAVWNQFSKNMDYVITENMLSTISDAELIGVANNLDSFKKLQANVPIIHLDTWLNTTGRFDSGYNWKTGAEWRSFFDNSLNLPDHILVNVGSLEVA
jgi:hypothetical protein